MSSILIASLSIGLGTACSKERILCFLFVSGIDHSFLTSCRYSSGRYREYFRAKSNQKKPFSIGLVEIKIVIGTLYSITEGMTWLRLPFQPSSRLIQTDLGGGVEPFWIISTNWSEERKVQPLAFNQRMQCKNNFSVGL